MANVNVYEMVTNRIIEQLNAGVIPWHKPWKCVGVKGAKIDLSKVAFNRVTKQAYSMLNQMLLAEVGEYASFKQWQEAGGHIKKGAKAEMVVFWKWLEILKTEEELQEGEVLGEAVKKIPYLKYNQVFHISQVEGVKPLKLKAEEISVPEFDTDAEADSIINNYSLRERISIRYGGDRAYYSPHADYIQVPMREQFGDNKAEFYSTLFHEIVHSTGAKHRLDRIQTTAHFGSEEYSKEELVAEIGASGMLNLLSIETPKSFNNSVAYVQSWIKALQNDVRMIVQASAKAEKSINFILNGKEAQA